MFATQPSPVVRLYDPAGLVAEALAERLQSVLGTTATVDIAPSAGAGWAQSAQVILIRLGCPRCGGAKGGIDAATQLVQYAPWTSLVFWVDEVLNPVELDCARSLGLSRIMDAHALVEWLPRAVLPLASLSAARYAVMTAESEVPPWPAWQNRASNGETRTQSVTLNQAEHAFREQYLRVLLAKCQSRRAVAEAAGVPYTTLVSMLRKLDIRG